MRKVVLPGKQEAIGEETRIKEKPLIEDEDEIKPLLNQLPSEILKIIKPAFTVGAFTGASGVFVGAFAGVARSSTPKLFALVSGIQWFTLGTTFWGSRELLLHEWGAERNTIHNNVYASAMAGALAGSAGGLLRGRSNIIPGAVMFALFGSAGQALYNRIDAHKSTQPEVAAQPKNFLWLNSKWNPMKVLTDAEYEDMLQEKLLWFNAKIALIDESIETLKVEEKELASKPAVEKEELDAK